MDDTTIPRRQLLLAALGTAALAAAPAVRAQARGELLLGQSAVLSGPLGKTITALNQGMQLALDQANATGGVHGQSLKLVSLDDELKPEKAIAHYKALAGDHRVVTIDRPGSGYSACPASAATRWVTEPGPRPRARPTSCAPRTDAKRRCWSITS